MAIFNVQSNLIIVAVDDHNFVVAVAPVIVLTLVLVDIVLVFVIITIVVVAVICVLDKYIIPF
jgi:hypothetical protein